MATVAQIIEQYNAERPNQTEDSVKVLWLRKCEQMLINEIYVQHEHDLEDESKMSFKVVGSTLWITRGGSFTDHISNFDMDSKLLVPEPYDDLYLHYIDQKIAYLNNDKARFNTASTMFNNALLTYQQYFNRTYQTKKVEKKLFNHSNL